MVIDRQTEPDITSFDKTRFSQKSIWHTIRDYNTYTAAAVLSEADFSIIIIFFNNISHNLTVFNETITQTV